MKKNLAYIFAVLIVFFLTNNIMMSSTAFATALPPGTTGGAIGSLADLGGGYTVLADTNYLSFGFGSPQNAGDVEETVLSGLSSNTFCATCLSFLYQVYVPTGSIEQLSASSFAGALVDVEQYISGSGIGHMYTGNVSASTADRSIDGGTVSFDWPGGSPLTAGDTSYIEIINTNATAYTSGLIVLSDSGSSESLTGFAPTSVPEPSSLLLLVSGLAGLGLWGRKRFKG